MIEHHLDIQTQDGLMNTFVTHPEENGPFPVVLFYMDAPGKREELHDMARRIATTGYVVVLPNLYYRKTKEFVWARTDAGMKAMFEMTKHLSLELIMQDTAALLDFVDGIRCCQQRPSWRRRLLHERALRVQSRWLLPRTNRLRGLDLRRELTHQTR